MTGLVFGSVVWTSLIQLHSIILSNSWQMIWLHKKVWLNPSYSGWQDLYLSLLSILNIATSTYPTHGRWSDYAWRDGLIHPIVSVRICTWVCCPSLIQPNIKFKSSNSWQIAWLSMQRKLWPSYSGWHDLNHVTCHASLVQPHQLCNLWQMTWLHSQGKQH